MGALDGVRILDFSTLLPGPFATMNLADMGADVLRIAAAGRPDAIEMFPPYVAGTHYSVTAAQILRNKRVMTMDLKNPLAVEIVRKLVAYYDIVVEQFRPGVMNRLGLGYASLREANQALIYCSLTGYGQTGPNADRAGHDINYLATAGAFGYSGTRERPALMGIQVADLAAGANNVMVAVLAAVICRMRTGQGQSLDIAMTDGALAFNALSGPSTLATNNTPRRGRDAYNGGTLYDFYETKDGEFMALGADEPKFFALFAHGIGRPEWADRGIRAGDELKAEVAQVIASRTRREWEDAFAGVDACFDPVQSLAEALESENAKAREMVVDVPTPDGQSVRQIGSPFKFSATPVEFRHSGHSKDESMHRQVLNEIGCSSEDITAWEQSGLFN